jgi:hypothetical protein
MLVLDRVFGGEQSDFQTWKSAPADSSRLIWDSKTVALKMSDFGEEFFRRLHIELNRPMLLRKGELHRLVQIIDPATIPNEVSQKLDALRALIVGP